MLYADLPTGGKLNCYLADTDRRAEELFLRMVTRMADTDSVTEKLKAANQME